jgi:hypothetical protein
MRNRSRIATASLIAAAGFAALGASVAGAAPVDGPGQFQPPPPNSVPPTASVSNGQVVEGNAGVKSMNFVVSLNKAWNKQVTVWLITTNVAQSPAEADDYVQKMGPPLHFPPGVTQKLWPVKVNGDTVDEYNEYFGVKITTVDGGKVGDSFGLGKIIDDDAPPSVSVGHLSKLEGTGGTTAFHFPVKLSAASEKPVKAVVNTVAGSAVSPSDWQAGQLVLAFSPGQTQKLYKVSVVGDSVYEDNETFTVKLSQAVNATLGNASGTGTIVNDDEKPAEPEDGAGDGGGNGGDGGGGGGGGQGNGAPAIVPAAGDQTGEATAAEGEQALPELDTDEVAAERRAEDGISLSTWLLLLATGITGIGLLILVIARRRRQI